MQSQNTEQVPSPKIKVRQAIIVEGKYDKIKLESFIDGVILPTNGFRIFKDPEKCRMLCTLADTVGLLVMTDSDVAGFKIRNFIRSITKNSPNITNIYIPQIAGKEKRKHAPSKEGTLGVEGLEISLLKKLLEQQQISYQLATPTLPITKLDLYETGLTGADYSALRRRQLLNYFHLPQYLTANSLLPVLNTLISREDYFQLIERLFEKEDTSSETSP